MRMRSLAPAAFYLLSGISTAGAVDIRAVNPTQRLVLPQIKSITVTPLSVIGGGTANGTVTLAVAAGAGGVTVKFQSSNPVIAAVPTNVVVQPGAASATFMVQTSPVAMNPNVVTDAPSANISAQIGASTPVSVKLTVQPPTLASLTLNPTSVPGGTASTGQVTFTGAAPSGGLVATLSTPGTEPPAVRADLALIRQAPTVSVPGKVTVPAGSTTASFPIATRGVTASTPFQITAAYGTFVTKTATLTLLPPVVASFTFSPDAPIGGNSTTGTVTLTAPAPPDGATFPITLTSSSHGCGPDPTAPAIMQIAAGSPYGTFTVSTSPGFGEYFFRVSGKTARILLREPLISANTLVFPASVKGGTTVQAKLVFNGAAGPPNCGNSHKLESNNTALAQVPASLTTPQGASEVPFTITTTAVPSTQTVTITVFGNVGYGYASYQKTLTLTP